MRSKLLIVLFGLGLMLRLIGISSHPVGFTPDEASFGYDAYSLLTTGHDQWGNYYPLTLKSFGDYKLPLYAYLTMPSVSIFGLTKFAVRLPNALIGSLAILVVYGLSFEVFKKKKIALWSAFLLAISPWHVLLSRGAFEANLTTFLMPLFIWLFIKGTKKNIYFVPAAIAFGLNIFSYHSARIITPLILVVLLVSFRKTISRNKWSFISAILVLTAILLAAISVFNGGAQRAATSTVFGLVGGEAGNIQYLTVLSGAPSVLSRLFYNKVFYSIYVISKSYLSYFSLHFLFTQGPAEGTYGMIPGRGVLYLFEIIFLMVILRDIIIKKEKIPFWLLFWVLISPLPASLATGPGYAANRVAVLLPSLQIILALGAVSFFSEVKGVIKKRTLLITTSLVVVISIFSFVFDLWFLQPARESKAMIYGAEEALQIASQNEAKYKSIIISRSISEPHMYVAFENMMSPEIFVKESKAWDYKRLGLSWVDQISEYHLGKYQFKSIDTVADFRKSNVLIIGKPSDFNPDTKTYKIIYYPDNTEAYWLVETGNIQK